MPYYVLLCESPKRSIKSLNRSKAPCASIRHRVISEHSDIVEATEAKIALRVSFKDWEKANRRWFKESARLTMMPCAPAFRKWLEHAKEKHRNERPRKPA